MIRNYIITAFRNLIKYRSYSFINIFGLTIGIACSLLISLYIWNEITFDKFHQKHKRIFRISTTAKLTNELMDIAPTSYRLANELQSRFPEVEQSVRIRPVNNRAVLYNGKIKFEDNFLYVDSSFFDVFYSEFLFGNPKTAFAKQNSLVLSASTAKRYFKGENPVGKKVTITNNWSLNRNREGEEPLEYEVSAVVKDYPENSYLKFDFLASLSIAKPQLSLTSLFTGQLYTFVLLRPNANPQKLAARIPIVLEKELNQQIKFYFNSSFSDFHKSGNIWKYHAIALDKIHLYSKFRFDMGEQGDIDYVYIFAAISIFILLIACINFTNLSTSRAMSRAKEIGIRKVLGAQKNNLRYQFLVESIVYSLVSGFLATAIVELVFSRFTQIVDIQIAERILNIPEVIPLLVLLGVVTGIIAGVYPAFYLSTFKPEAVLRKKITLLTGKNFRNILVVFQFAIGITIMTSSYVVFLQLKYLQNRKLGFDKDNILVIERTNPIKSKVEEFMKEVKRLPEVVSVSLAANTPGRLLSTNVLQLENDTSSKGYIMTNIAVDENYLNTMGVKLVSGRFFSPDSLGDTLAIVVNQRAADMIKKEKLVGENFVYYVSKDSQKTVSAKVKLPIIGIIRDFNFESLHRFVTPMYLSFIRWKFDGYINIRLKPDTWQKVVPLVNNIWKNYSKEQDMRYFRYNEEFAKLYKAEKRTERLLLLFTILSVLIACLGLFGLISFTIVQRTKEIAIRKILGAKQSVLVFFLSIDSLKLVFLSCIFAFPVSWIGLKIWLDSFSYKIQLSPLYFLPIAGLALFIAVLTVSIQAYRATLQNPAESLKCEN